MSSPCWVLIARCDRIRPQASQAKPQIFKLEFNMHNRSLNNLLQSELSGSKVENPGESLGLRAA